MRRNILYLLLIVLALGAIEGFSYWWMHPAPAGLGEPVLVYRPGLENRPDRPASGDFESSSSQPPISSTTTLLPDVVANALLSLRCSTGTAARIDREDGVTIHVAFFEWDLSDSSNVLEAFKHLPEQCMGSIGMILTEKAPPRSYRIGSETLSFDHTVFRDPGGTVVHAFKGTWVSGSSTLIGDGLRGGEEQWNQLRWKAAIKRFRPAHARVAQGAVRGIRNPDLAWQAFEDAMLTDLRLTGP